MHVELGRINSILQLSKKERKALIASDELTETRRMNEMPRPEYGKSYYVSLHCSRRAYPPPPILSFFLWLSHLFSFYFSDIITNSHNHLFYMNRSTFLMQRYQKVEVEERLRPWMLFYCTKDNDFEGTALPLSRSTCFSFTFFKTTDRSNETFQH